MIGSVLAKEKSGTPAGAPGGAPLPRDRGEDAPEDHHAFVCARCETEICETRALFSMRASSPVQVFPNPFGQMRKILTVRDARSLVVEEGATTDFTWFAGYSWRIAHCASCRTHLGWMFEAVEGGEPKTFFGLLEHELIER